MVPKKDADSHVFLATRLTLHTPIIPFCSVIFGHHINFWRGHASHEQQVIGRVGADLIQLDKGCETEGVQ